ncbi:ABC transporter ATP-binding protein [Mesorhizobium hawassense]|uniref:ABC transporter ATP-binding protein n=1 Tax=Mesorhizobium hawassense TaxID=1209954 RepID=A0A330HQ87_9HYPH|nr:ABC transporter ATP-binding protein [Mesorhizobium hawassense]RAZ88819.1 ABC transporter ATP-binding protein [Mesorhizobium hawassense]
MNDTSLLTVEKLEISYRKDGLLLPVVKDFSLRLAPSETYGLVGESGCGKSTVAYALLGYLSEHGVITDGSITLNGTDVRKLDHAGLRKLRGGDVAMVYQEPVSALNPVLTIGRQLREARLAKRDCSKADANDASISMLKAVQLPDPAAMFDRYPHELSGGQAQRVVIAMALLAEPKLLVLDEPTTGLDATVEAEVVELIANLGRKLGTAILYISHNLTLVGRICERVGVMYSGRIVEEAPTRQLFQQPRHPYTAGLLGCRPYSAAAGKNRRLATIPGNVPLPGQEPAGCSFGPRCQYFEPGRCDQLPGPILEAVAGPTRVRCVRRDEIVPQTLVPVSVAHRPKSGSSVIEVEALVKSYAPRHALRFGGKSPGPEARNANDKISLSVKGGEILSIVGESGSGKSTLAKIAIGLEEATSGRMITFGQDVAQVRARRRPLHLLHKIQMIFQNPDSTLNPAHTIGAIIGRAVRCVNGKQSAADIKRHVDSLLAAVALPPEFRHKYPHELSGGQRQRVGIARAFAGHPEVIIADEPVSALDVSIQAAIVNLLLDMQAHAGTTFLFISHDVALVRHLSDRVAVLYGGQLMEMGTVDEVFSPPFHPYTARLISAASGRAASGGPKSEGKVGQHASCRFFEQCHVRIDGLCDRETPPRREGSESHSVTCHHELSELAMQPILVSETM